MEVPDPIGPLSLTPEPLPEPRDPIPEPTPDLLSGLPPRTSVLPGSPSAPRRPKLPRTVAAIQGVIADIKSGRIDPATFSPELRRSVVAILADGRLAPRDIAFVLKVTADRVRRDLERIRKKAGKRIVAWTLETAVGYLESAAEVSYAMAVENGDAQLVFAIRRDFVKQLKELGVFGQDSRDGVRITIEGVGTGMDKALEALETSMDPRLTGERIIDAKATVRDSSPLGLPMVLDPSAERSNVRLRRAPPKPQAGLDDEDPDEGEDDEEDAP